MSSEYYATIGTNGINPVVWGLGGQPESAFTDAEEELQRRGHLGYSVHLSHLLTLPITEGQAQAIGVVHGEVTAESLGIALPDFWLKDHGPTLHTYPAHLTL